MLWPRGGLKQPLWVGMAPQKFVPLQAVVSYTPEQMKDLLHLRLLFYSQVGQLCRERKALLRYMADEQDVGANIGLDDVSVRLSEVSDLAEQLRANSADEYRTYMQFSSAFSRRVSLRPYQDL